MQEPRNSPHRGHDGRAAEPGAADSATLASATRIQNRGQGSYVHPPLTYRSLVGGIRLP